MHCDDRGERLADAQRKALSVVAQRRAELEAIAREAATDGRDDEHDPDGATVAFEHSLTMGHLYRADEHLRAAEDALGRWRDGTYGRCVACGGEIAEARLAAEPAAPTCVECATELGSKSHTRRHRSLRRPH